MLKGNGVLTRGLAVTAQNRHFDFFHSTTGRVMFFAAAIIVLLFFAFTQVENF